MRVGTLLIPIGFGLAFGLGWKSVYRPDRRRSSGSDLQGWEKPSPESISPFCTEVATRVDQLDRLHRQQIFEVNTRFDKLKSQLSAGLDSHVDLRIQDLERRLHNDLGKAVDQSLDAFTAFIDTRVLQRISLLDQKLKEQSETMLELIEAFKLLVPAMEDRVKNQNIEPPVENVGKHTGAWRSKLAGLLMTVGFSLLGIAFVQNVLLKAAIH